MKKKRVLFICEDNDSACQMAEAIVNARLGGLWEAVSAGLGPARQVRPQVREILEEMDIRCNGNTRDISSFHPQEIDLVIAFCDGPFENYPEWLQQIQRMHVKVPTPGKLEASACCSHTAYLHLRREVVRHVPEALGQWTVNQAILPNTTLTSPQSQQRN